MRQPPHRRAGIEITYETDKVRTVWIEQIEQGRVALTARSIAVPAYGFQRHHQSNIVATMARCLCIDHAALLVAHEERRFLIYERDKANCHGGLDSDKSSGNFKQRSDTTCVIVCARASYDGVVVGSNQ